MSRELSSSIDENYRMKSKEWRSMLLMFDKFKCDQNLFKKSLWSRAQKSIKQLLNLSWLVLFLIERPPVAVFGLLDLKVHLFDSGTSRRIPLFSVSLSLFWLFRFFLISLCSYVPCSWVILSSLDGPKFSEKKWNESRTEPKFKYSKSF